MIGLKRDYISGQVLGLQDVKVVYELKDASWTAATSYDKKTLDVRSSAAKTVVNALLHVGK